MVIAIDATGGEYAPHEIVKGAIKAAKSIKLKLPWWAGETYSMCWQAAIWENWV